MNMPPRQRSITTNQRYCAVWPHAARCAWPRLSTLILGQQLAVATLTGCGEAPAGPPPISTELRQSIRQDLVSLGAKVTAEDAEGVYASLRNTHVELLPSGGVVEGAPRSRQDLQDFGRVNEAIAKRFLEGGEVAGFQQWLRDGMSPSKPNSGRAEYGRYQPNMSRSPLRVVFSPRAAVVE